MSENKKTPTYVLSAALVASLGLNGIQAGLLPEAKAGRNDTETGNAVITITGGALATFESFVSPRACPQINAEHDLAGEDVCNLAEDETYRFSGRKYLNEGVPEIVMRVNPPVEVTVTPGHQ